jgi:Xaa-Pro dipeptidase
MTPSSNSDAFWQDHINHVIEQYCSVLDDQGVDALLVHAGVSAGFFLDDNHASFRANPIFTHLVPNLDTAENAWLMLVAGQRPVLCLYQPEDFWYGQPTPPEGTWCLDYEIHTFASTSALMRFLVSRTAGLSVAAVLPNEAVCDVSAFDQLALNPPHLINALHQTRLIKSPWEIEQIAAANRLSAKGHRAAYEAFINHGSERTIHQAYLSATEALDHELPYNAIVALNEHAAVLHYPSKERAPIQTPLTLLIDAGNTHSGYASDITRTFLHPNASEHAGFECFNALLDGVERLQTQMTREIRAGHTYLEYHQYMHARLLDLMLETGVLLKRPEQKEDELTLSKTFFPHGLGHHLGVQTHDVGAWQIPSEIREHVPPHPELPPKAHPFLRMAGVLQPGMVITLEPGLYFIPTLLRELHNSVLSDCVNWTIIESLIPFGGIRIEDNLVITEAEPRNLTREAFEQAL